MAGIPNLNPGPFDIQELLNEALRFLKSPGVRRLEYPRGYRTAADMPRNLPQYNDALGDFLKLPANLQQTYSDVLMQVYPLQADLDKLQAFCDDYFITDEGTLFEVRVAAPFVFMVLADYGKMALKSQNIGWVSQRELAFGFPVALYKSDGPSLPSYFVDWGLVYPFNYVDNPLSMSLGRQVYGWPKAGMELTAARPNLAPDLRCLATVDLYSGPPREVLGDASDLRFLEVFQRQPFVSGRVGAGGYFNYARTMAADYMSLLSSGFDLVSGAGSDWRKNPPVSIDDVAFKFASLTNQFFTGNDYIGKLLKSPSRSMRAGQTSVQAGNLKTLTVKQFRDAVEPRDSCYRAVVVSTMGYSQPKDGALFVSDPMSPDATGGVLIRLYDCLTNGSSVVGGAASSLPDPRNVVKSLGLAEACPSDDDGTRTIHTLQPVMPFWFKTDLTYNSADFEWSRTKYTLWTYDKKPPPKDYGTASPQPPLDQSGVGIPYKDVGSGAGQEVAGPLASRDYGLRIYPLVARYQTLQKLCETYLQPTGQNDFKFRLLCGPPNALVLMFVGSFDELSGTSKGAPTTNLHDRIVTFAVPAYCEYQGVNKGIVLIALYTFVEQDWDFLTEYEVYGRVAFKSELQSPPENWIDDSKHIVEVLNAYSTIFPGEAKQPQSAQAMPLVQIKSHEVVDPYVILNESGSIKPEFLNPVPPLYSLGLKQVRDAVQPTYAAFQEIVSVRRDFTAGGANRMREKLDLFFYAYGKEFDIAKTMGIRGLRKDPIVLNGEKLDRYRLRVKYGFRVWGTMKEHPGVSLSWSVTDGVWTPGPNAAQGLPP